MNAFCTYSLVPGWLHSEITAVGEEHGYQCDAMRKDGYTFSELLCHEVCHTYGHELCEATIQKTGTDIKKLDLLRGSTKCAIWEDDEICPNF